MSAHRSGSHTRVPTLLAALAALLVPLGVAGPAAATVTSTFSESSNTLSVESDGADSIVLTCSAGQVKLGGADPLASPLTCSAVEAISVEGGPDDNVIDLSGVRLGNFTQLEGTQVQGGGGDDTITGTPLGESLSGEQGNDDLTGAGGDDTMLGGDGRDIMRWNNGDGSDVIEGQGDVDTTVVSGNTTAGDVITVQRNGLRARVERTNLGPFSLDLGTTEGVSVSGGGGNDTLTALAGAPVRILFNGDEGNDSLTGAEKEDTLRGGFGDDRIVGLGSADFVNGNEGDDTMIWNAADDVEGFGDDDVEGGAGVDTLLINGSAGDDEFAVEPSGSSGTRFSSPSGLNTGSTERVLINGGGGDDTITGSKAMPQTMEFDFRGQGGDDTIEGTDRPDRLLGGPGFDVVDAIDGAADDVQCGSGSDVGRVDANDSPSGCERIESPGIGRRVRLASKRIRVVDGVATLKLRCAATARCRGTVRLRRQGKTLGSKRFRATSRQARVVRVKLNGRGRDLLATALRDALGVVALINAWDADGNGWQSKVRTKLVRP